MKKKNINKVILKKFKRKLKSKLKRSLKRKHLNYVPKNERKLFIKIKKYSNKYIFFKCPKYISLDSHYEDFFKYVKKIENVVNNISYNKKPILIDMRNVESIDFSGISILITLILKLQQKKIKVNGLNPKDPNIYSLLNEFNFFENTGYRRLYYNNFYSEFGNYDKIFIKGDVKVNPQNGINITKFVSKKIFDDDKHVNDGLQTVLLELMANTTKWSEQTTDNNLWILSTYYDKNYKNVEFIFIDYGIGIFESLKKSEQHSTWYGEILNKFASNCNVLKNMLEGDSSIYKSSTGLYYRGKGIPSLKTKLKDKYINDLKIYTNDVRGVIDLDIYDNMSNKFNGTIVSWNINKDNVFFKI